MGFGSGAGHGFCGGETVFALATKPPHPQEKTNTNGIEDIFMLLIITIIDEVGRILLLAQLGGSRVTILSNNYLL